MKRFAQLVVLASLMCPLTAVAQSKPDFSGTWTMDIARSDSAKTADNPSGSPVTLVITQNDKEVRVETQRKGRSEVAKYPVESAERPVGTSGGSDVGSIVHWEDGNLETFTPHELNGMAVTTIERRTLSADGQEMTVLTTLQVQHGYQDGPNYSTAAKDVYRRAR